MKLKRFQHPVLLSLLFATSASAMTVTVVEANFDTTSPGYSYGYEYSGYGSGSPNVNTDTSGSSTSVHNQTGAGNLGNSAQTTADFTALSTIIPGTNNYAYDGLGNGVGFNIGAWAGGSPTLLPEEFHHYVLEFDYFVGGSSNATTPGGMELEFRTPDGVLPVDPINNPGIDRLYQGGYANGSYTLDVGKWTTVRVPIIDLPFVDGSQALFEAYADQVVQVQINLGVNSDTAFGYDADNILAIDNFRLLLIPEPSRILLLGFGLVFLVLRRQR